MGERPATAAITTALSAVIGVPLEQVWRAVSEPAERIRWDPCVEALVAPADGFPALGTEARWQYRLRGLPVILRDRPIEVRLGCRLRSEVALGLFHFEQTWSLQATEAGDQTHLGLQLAAASSMAVVGGTVDRFDVRRLSAQYVDEKLRALRERYERPTTTPTRAALLTRQQGEPGR